MNNMIQPIVFTHAGILKMAQDLGERILAQPVFEPAITQKQRIQVYGIPRGGVHVAYALLAVHGEYFDLVSDPNVADIFVDDLIDSGDTMQRWCDAYPGRPFFALIDKTDPVDASKYVGWLTFPWETEESSGVEDNIKRILQYIGEDPSRGGLLETPARVAKAWKFWTKGYGQDPKDILKVFEDGADGCDEMVVVKNIPFYTHCEHHMAPFFGTATVAYIPTGKIVGLSKLSRLVEIFARRLQVQERLTNQIADALNDNLQPKGVGVVIKARHMCMESRGVCQQGSETVTSALRGAMRDQPCTRAEFLALANGAK